MKPKPSPYSPRNSTALHSRVLPPIINAGQQEAALIVLFGFFRTADLGRQYDTVSRVGGNFSFLFRHIHPSVYHIRGHVLSISPSRPTLVYSTPWDSPVCGPAPQVYFWFFITRGCYPRYSRLIAMAFLGALAFWDTTSCPPGNIPSYFLENLQPAPPPHRRWQTRSRLFPDQAGHDYILNFKLRARPSRLNLGSVSLDLVWLLLAAPSARCS